MKENVRRLRGVPPVRGELIGEYIEQCGHIFRRMWGN